MKLLRRLFPHPLLTLLLTLVWLMLVNRFSWNSVIFGFFLGVLIPFVISPYWPGMSRVRHTIKIVEYILVVIYDIMVANVTVARLILFKSNADMKQAWISVPLRLRTPEAITTLAGTITLTPGTVSCDLSSGGHYLLVHCLHAPEPEKVRQGIIDRYESRLMEIFE
ncbi:Na+/H+ antiporter subunit E [Albibacillus kandeliae]|uniref:Na+/H+ antiporter subunit E n=1 Tax=Albibacillus kandeliae TaxID=2174228 RepID=UPI000D69F934|nr:Na+/H+ antiporter subunit E [Albibacillus kandeliae]